MQAFQAPPRASCGGARTGRAWADCFPTGTGIPRGKMCWLSDCAGSLLRRCQSSGWCAIPARRTGGEISFWGTSLPCHATGVPLAGGKIGITFTFRLPHCGADKMPVLRHSTKIISFQSFSSLIIRFHRLMMAAETKAMHSEGRLAARSSMGNGLCGLATCHARRNSKPAKGFVTRPVPVPAWPRRARRGFSFCVAKPRTAGAG